MEHFDTMPIGRNDFSNSAEFFFILLKRDKLVSLSLEDTVAYHLIGINQRIFMYKELTAAAFVFT